MAKGPHSWQRRLPRLRSPHRPHVQGVGDERSPALKVAAELIDVDAHERLMAEAKRTLFARRFAVDGAGARWRATAHWAATQGSDGW